LIYIKAVNRISSTPPNRIIVTEKKNTKNREPDYLPSTTSPYFEKASLKLCSSVENETPETQTKTRDGCICIYINHHYQRNTEEKA